MPTPPVAKRVEGPDPWAWLRDRDDPDTLAYLRAENAYADAWFEPLAPLREAVFGEIKARTQETDLSVPVRRGPWWYYARTVEGLDYAIHCRRRTEHGGEDDPEQVLLDENVLAEGHAYHELGALEVSEGHRLLAYSTDNDGSEVFTLRFRDLDTGTDLPDVIERTYYGVAWSADDRFVFYTRPDDAMRPYQVWRHELGADPASDVLVFQEDDERFNVGVALTRSRTLVLVETGSVTTSEVWMIPAADPTAAPVLVAAREQGVEYEVDHRGDHLLIVTNLDAPDFRLVRAPVATPGRDHWIEVLPHRPGCRLVAAMAFAGHVLLYEWADAQERLRLLFDDGSERAIELPEAVASVHPGANPEFDTDTVRFSYQSLVTPPAVFDEHVRTGERVLKKQQPVLGDFDPSRYRSERTWATAPDGTAVPISLVRRADLADDGTAPGVLYGYGAYEHSLSPWFSVARLSLLDRGVVFAVAHVRGGGELGRRWYLDGKMAKKMNSFTDFIACAEHLMARGVVARHRLAARGGSAGGLLVGASTALRPELFAAVVAEVPFVDVLNTMSDPTLPLTVTEWEEWGNPAVAEERAHIAAYSPYDNVRPVPYPAMYVVAGLNDPRVSYHEPAKWVARLRAEVPGWSDEHPLLLRTDLEAGHGGVSGRYDSWRDEARVIAFLLRTLGVA